ncbi:MAG: nucleotide exchange factor GrpE [Oleispira antarctica]|nr:nucleotide exchange factor GrpE [Oleispira antarctica]MBQ0791378.1 nucleotide exchange factor GrpE [Oleispira antarctica]|tara:strand:- start:2597 stop:3184 length:588 start_codon:yes stop_codon:yes gene_type:complete
MSQQNDENLETTPVDVEEQVNAAEEQAVEELSVEEALKIELVATQNEVAELKDQMLRVQADAQNVRRRSEQDVEKAHKFGQEKLSRELLSVLDNLERALAATPEDEATKALRDGVDMTLQGFISTLAKFNVEAIDPQGETFNPEYHQAMAMQENADFPPNTVMAVMQKGYSLHGRLLRPAMVMVSKGAPTIDENA